MGVINIDENMSYSISNELTHSINDISNEINSKINKNIEAVQKAFEENELKFNSLEKDEREKDSSSEICLRLISDAVFRYEGCEKCSKYINSSNHTLLETFITRIKTDGTNTTLILSDMSLNEIISFFNRIISFISTDMMMFPKYALDWKDFPDAFIDILENPISDTIYNLRLLDKTFRNLQNLRSSRFLQSSGLDHDGDDFGINCDVMKEILNSKPF